MSAISELLELKTRLDAQIEGLRSELNVISRTIKILERENPSQSPQMVIEGLRTRDDGAVRTYHMGDPDGPGLTDRCLSLLSDTDWSTPSTIRDRLLATNYHMTDRGKLLSSVYATMKRLATQGRIESQKSATGTVFRKKAAQ